MKKSHWPLTTSGRSKALPRAAFLQQQLHDWYRANARTLPWRQTTDPYHIWVSEVMLQQTQVKTVIGYFNRFVKQFPDINALAAADQQRVLKLWEGLGYYARARHLQAAAAQLVEAGEWRVPDSPDRFRRLPGVGDYINAAVMSIAFGHRLAVVDGNVKRVLSRIFLIEAPVNRPASHKTFQALADQLLDERAPGTYNQALMELGATVCRPRQPLCAGCPVRSICQAAEKDKTREYPRRIVSAKVPQRHRAAAVICKPDRVLIVKRPPEGLLGGLWEFPGLWLDDDRPEQPVGPAEIAQAVNLEIADSRHLIRVRHTYTHFKLVLDVYLCQFRSGRVRRQGPAAHAWVRPGGLKRYPFHTAVHKALPALVAALTPSTDP